MDSNSIDTASIYVTREPDWSRGVSLSLSHSTLVFQSRAGLEQRTRQRATPIYRLAYTERGLNPAQYAQRQARAAAEVALPLWLPFWTERARLTHDMTDTSAQIDADPSADFFAPGQLVYIGGQFRTITAATGRTLTLAVDGTATAWPAGTKAYPVRYVRRIMGEDGQRRKSLQSYEETLIFETIT